MKPLLVGIAGAHESGKSTFMGYVRDALYSKYETYACVETNKAIYNYLAHAFRMSEVNFYEKTPFIRFILEQTGVWLRKNEPEFMKNFVKDSYAQYAHTNTIVLMAGVRRINEARVIKDLGGIIVRVYRSTGKPAQPSEDELHYITGDYVIDNNSGLIALENNAEAFVDFLLKLKQTLNTNETKN